MYRRNRSLPWVVAGILGALALIFGGIALAQAGGGGSPATTTSTNPSNTSTSVPVTTSTTPKAAPGTCPGDHEIAVGDTTPYLAKAGCVGKGDVYYGASQQGPFDQKAYRGGLADNGTIFVIDKDVWIQTKNGANIGPRSVDSLEAELRATGCVSHQGCKTVDLIHLPGGTLTQLPNPDGSPSASTTTVPSGTGPSDCRYGLRSGEYHLVHAGCRLKGDVMFSTHGNYVKAYRGQDSHNGTILVFVADTWVYGNAGGANITDRALPDLKVEMFATGCEAGCDTIEVREMPSNKVLESLRK